jgi:cell wall-associated NlpC family hydrolase
MPINGVALTSVAAGSILLWSGVKGWNVTRTVGEIITGQTPKGSEENILVSASSSSSSSAVGSTNSAMANDALSYAGHGYTYGGAPGKDGKSNWDCSSFINWVVGHDGKRAIPGYSAGQYNGTVHGPPTGSWGVWPGLKHIKLADLQPGDIIVWVGHMGMCVGTNQMISALNSKLGTKVTPIAGYGNGPLLCYGRLI